MTKNFLIAINVLALAWIIIKLIRLDRVRKEFFAAGVKKNLEEVLIDQNRTLTKISKDVTRLNKILTDLSKLNESNLQKVGFVRFNPFADSGSNMSFSLALLNANKDGVVISSLHSREGTRIYAKAIKKGGSDSKLTEEEIKAIKEAK